MSTMTVAPVRSFANPRVSRPAVRADAVRLTRRGRLVVFLAALVAVLIISVAIGAGSVATDEPAPTTVVHVAPGQTLWDIASGVTPAGDDVRATMYDIKALNDLESSALAAGQVIRVPAAE